MNMRILQLYLLASILWITEQLVSNYTFKRVCEYCSSCSSDKQGSYCTITKGGPYDGQRWEWPNQCRAKDYCDRYYPQTIEIFQSDACFDYQCRRRSTFIDGTVPTPFCSNDQHLCNYDPNATNNSTLFVIIGIIAGVLIVGFTVYKCSRNNKKQQALLQQE